MLPDELPTLPVLVPLTAVASAAVLSWLHRRGRLTAPRALLGLVACLYGAGVLGHVLLPFPIDTGDPRPWRVWLHLTPLVDVAQDPIGIVLNIVLFVPLGLLVPLLVPRVSARRVVLCGFGSSLAIEAGQLLADLTVSPGRVADVDDLLGNTVGTMLGYAVVRALLTVPALARRAAPLAWTPRTPAVAEVWRR